MKLFGVSGFPISHSLSPEIFKIFFKKYRLNTKYIRISENNEKHLLKLIKSQNFDFVNVTSPLKQRVLGFLDYKDIYVKESNSCNVIINNKNKLYGFNTDITALKILFEKAFFKINENKIKNDNKYYKKYYKNKRYNKYYKSNIVFKNSYNILILGAGGTAYSALFALKLILNKFSYKFYIDIFNRTFSKANNLKNQFLDKFIIDTICVLDKNELLLNFNKYEIIVNTIPDNHYLQSIFKNFIEIQSFKNNLNNDLKINLISSLKHINNLKKYLKSNSNNIKNRIIIDANYKNSFFKDFAKLLNYQFIDGVQWLILQAIEGYKCFYEKFMYYDKGNQLNNNFKINNKNNSLKIDNKIKFNKILKKIQNIKEKEKSKKNIGIAFIGFMASGKTTVAKEFFKVLESKYNNFKNNEFKYNEFNYNKLKYNKLKYNKSKHDNLNSRFKCIDTDELIEKIYGTEIYKIFEDYGEKKFRKIESKIIKEIVRYGLKLDKNINTKKINIKNINKKNTSINKKNIYNTDIKKCIKIVLSVGGGAILDKKIRKLLKKHFFVVWLISDIETIIKRIRNDKTIRPLSINISKKNISKNFIDTNKLINLFEKRKPLYAEISDITVLNQNKEIEQIVEMVTKELEM